MNETVNVYNLPIDMKSVTSVQSDSIAHVGDLVNSIDYDAPEGTPVFAALDGIVIDVKDDSDRGGDDPSFEDEANYIEIEHVNGEISEYEHLKKGSSKVKVGDHVVTGQVIAEVGNTGWSECPHLHFMVYPKGEGYKTKVIRFEDEQLQCFDENGEPSEVQPRSEVKSHPEKYYCGVANIWLVNDQGQLLVSKRSDWVAGNPSKWQTYFGGHVTAGISFQETAVKELEEEIGLNVSEKELFLVSKGKDEAHRRFFESYALRFNGLPDSLSFTDDEIVDAKWMDMDEYWKDRESNPDRWCNSCRPEKQNIIKDWIKQIG